MDVLSQFISVLRHSEQAALASKSGVKLYAFADDNV